jgi:hypothetical protein
MLSICARFACIDADTLSPPHQHGESEMKSKLLIAVIAAAFFPLATFANECSGGADGGMDATGNQCSTPPAVTTASSDRAATSATPTKAEVKKVAARKGTAAPRNASVRARVKHG